jgi:hypothetical protein
MDSFRDFGCNSRFCIRRWLSSYSGSSLAVGALAGNSLEDRSLGVEVAILERKHIGWESVSSKSASNRLRSECAASGLIAV